MDVIQLVKRHEGLRVKPYRDTTGHLTIGYGRNLDAEGISEREAEGLLTNDLAGVTARLAELEIWPHLDEVRQSVLVDMAFNLGYQGLMGFQGMFLALEQGNYNQAADHIYNSKAARQAPERYAELYRMMLTGNWPGEGA
jgi:lysozyme